MINRLPLSPLSRSLALDLFTSRPSPSSPSLPTLSISRTRSHHSVSYSSTYTSTPIYAITRTLTEPVQNAPTLSISRAHLSTSLHLRRLLIATYTAFRPPLYNSLTRLPSVFSLNLSSIYSFSTSISSSPNTFAHIGATSIIPITHGHNTYIMHTNTARTQI